MPSLLSFMRPGGNPGGMIDRLRRKSVAPIAPPPGQNLTGVPVTEANPDLMRQRRDAVDPTVTGVPSAADQLFHGATPEEILRKKKLMSAANAASMLFPAA